MASKALPSPEVLRQLLRYEPDTGKLFWRERGPEWFLGHSRSPETISAAFNGRLANKEALTVVEPSGYKSGQVFTKKAYAHRVAWAIMTGRWPKAHIDHIDTDASNNRWSNLREATPSENARNRSVQANNKSGAKGVYWSTAEGAWKAQIKINGKNIGLGRHDTLEAAKEAYAKASQEIHGPFGRV